MNKKDKDKKIKEYEDFINNTLKVDLREIENQLNKKSEDLKNWNDVKRITKLYRLHNDYVDNNLTLYNRLFRKSHYELFAKAEINNVNKIYVAIGCSCLLEMDLDEADKYADIRIKVVEKQIAHFCKMAVQVKVNIKTVLLAINELNPIQNSVY